MEETLRILGWMLGLTREKRTELSDVICEEGIFRKVVDFFENTPVCEYGCCVGNTWYTKRETAYFSGPNGLHFDFPPDSIPSLSDGERVLIKYRTVFSVTQDYTLPDFSQKDETTRKTVDRVYDSYERIQGQKPLAVRVNDRRQFYRPAFSL